MADREDAALMVQLAQWGAMIGLQQAAKALLSDDFNPDTASSDDDNVVTVCNFYETVGTLTKNGLLSTELKGVEFEHFVAHVLEAMGYRTQITAASGDGGFDIIAHRDPLGLEPPIIKVQCKRTADAIGAPTVQSLTGALAPGGDELGLFVTLGSYSRDAVHLGRTRQDLRLITGADLVQLIFDHYEKFAPQWKALLPMRAVYVVDREPGV